MTARSVSFAFLCEGSSDTGLIAHLETLLVYFGAQEATGMPDTRKGTIPARLRQLLTEGTEAGIDMVFIHRDSDSPDREGREREIRRGIEESGFPHPFIPVIPVQETEAWLLLDEQAIRDVVACAGVRIFSDGRNPKDGSSLAVTRRAARAMRRRRDRLLKRKARMMNKLVEYGFFPADVAERKKLERINPYELRAKGLDAPLTPGEFARALFHINQRRGFKSNRKTDKKENDSGALKAEIGRAHV